MLTLPELFLGQTRAFGRFKAEGPSSSKGKQEGKAVTLSKDVTESLWQMHMSGHQSLGIIPIRDDSNCRWGVIDIDVYESPDWTPIFNSIRQHKMPLVPCSSKSGGLHLFLFLAQWTPAGKVQSLLRHWASILGYGACEIWPKQATVNAAKGDLGNWLNMPYFGDSRKGMDLDGNTLELPAFLEFAAANRKEFNELLNLVEPRNKQHLPDGPPCLESIVSRTVGKGHRNTILFNLGVYYKKVDPLDWENALTRANSKHIRPSVSPEELTNVINHLKKKEYFYQCSQPPLRDFCHKAVCRTCKFGIGEGVQVTPDLGTLTKVETEPPIYFMDVNGMRIQLSSEDLYSQAGFQKVCIEQANLFPSPMKGEEWRKTINNLLSNLVVVSVPESASVRSMLWESLQDYLTVYFRRGGKLHLKEGPAEDLLLGRPIYFNGRFVFQLAGWIAEMERKREKYHTTLGGNGLIDCLRQWNAKNERLYIGGVSRNVWSIQLENPERLVERPQGTPETPEEAC